jgi:hypothetical protein
MAREEPTVVRKVETRVVREATRCSPLLKSTALLSHSTSHSTVTDYQPQHKSLAPPLFFLLLSSTIKLLAIRILAGMATMAAVAAAERLTGVSREWIHRVDNVSARLVLLQSIRTAVIQAGARFQWREDYDRFPTMQVHTLLGVGESTVALREAGNGLLTKIVGAAAEFALRASRERARAGT